MLCLDHITGDSPTDECFGHWSMVPVPDGFGYTYDPAWQAFSLQQDGTIYWTLLQGALVVADSLLERTQVDCDNEQFRSQEECIAYCTDVVYTVAEVSAYEPCVASCKITCPAAASDDLGAVAIVVVSLACLVGLSLGLAFMGIKHKPDGSAEKSEPFLS